MTRPLLPERAHHRRGASRFANLYLAFALAMPVLCGCSIKQYALRSVADALSAPGGAGGLGEESDAELARDAAPFGLKTMEQILASVPDHQRLHLALGSGFVQYTYAFVQQEADRLENTDIKRAKTRWLRARRLYLRGRDYALGGLELHHPGTKAAVLSGDAGKREAALQRMNAADVPYLYWAAAGWALAISDSKDDPEMIGDLPTVEELMARALALDESFDQGAIHEFYVTYDAARDKTQGGGPEAAKKHLDRALALSRGRRVGPLVSYAEGVLVLLGRKAEFTQMLKRVVDTDVYSDEDGWKQERLPNIINQERAKWLLSRTADLFVE